MMPTIEPTPEVVIPAITKPVKNLLMAMALADDARERIDRINRRVLEAGDFRIDPKWREGNERITDPDRTYLMDLDSAEHWAYHNTCAAMAVLAGENADEIAEGKCPALVAENLRTSAEIALIEASEPFFGVTNHQLCCAGLEKRKRFIDLMIGLVVNRPDFNLDIKEYTRA